MKHREKTLTEQRRELKANSVHIIMALIDGIIYGNAYSFYRRIFADIIVYIFTHNHTS